MALALVRADRSAALKLFRSALGLVVPASADDEYIGELAERALSDLISYRNEHETAILAQEEGSKWPKPAVIGREAPVAPCETAETPAKSVEYAEFDLDFVADHLSWRGLSARTRKNKLAILGRIARELGSDFITGLIHGVPEYQLQSWLADQPPYVALEAPKVIEDCRVALEDLHISKGRPFSFAEISDGIGAFRLAAEAVGGACGGVWDPNLKAKPAYLTYFGRGDFKQTPAEACQNVDLVLACIAFNAFELASGVSAGGLPEFQALEKSISHGAKAFIARIEWSAADIVGAKPEALASYLSQSGFSVTPLIVETDTFLPMAGKELFLIGFRNTVPSRAGIRPILSERPVAFADFINPEFNGSAALAVSQAILSGLPQGTANFVNPAPARRITARYARNPAAALLETSKGIRRLAPAEIAAMLGFDRNYTLPDDYQLAWELLGSCPPIQVAKAVIRAVTARIE